MKRFFSEMVKALLEVLSAARAGLGLMIAALNTTYCSSTTSFQGYKLSHYLEALKLKRGTEKLLLEKIKFRICSNKIMG